MASAYASVAQALYVAYFGRPADVIGLSNIESALAAADTAGTGTTAAGLYAEYSTNAGIAAIVNSFGTSKESQTLYGSNTLNFVTAVFESLFNRAPAASGLLFWANAINTGAVTAGEAALAILAGASSADAATAAAKVTVATEFTTAMATSGTEINAYQGAAAAALARSLLQGVTTANSASYATNGDVQASLNSIVVQSTPVTNWTLTSGIDNFTLLGNNNHVTGTAHAPAGQTATFGAGDSIVGAAGSVGNTLTLADLSTGGTWTAGGVAGITVTNVQALVLESGEPTAVNTASSVEGFTGLQSVTVNDVGGSSVTAASTTTITINDAAAAGATEAAQGGSAVTVTANNVSSGGTINVGTTTAAAGAVSVTTTEISSQTGAVTADAINVGGGTTVAITANLAGTAGVGNTVTGGAIAVTGGAATTSVTVTQTAAATAGTKVAGVVDGGVTISDLNTTAGSAGTITSVTLANYGAATIEDNALASLTLSGSGHGVTLNDNSFATPLTSLTLNLNGVTDTSAAGFTDTHGEITTLNVVTGGTSGSSLTNVVDSGLKTLAVSGTHSLDITNAPASLTAVTVTGGAGVTITLGANTSFTSTSTGTDVVTVTAATTKTVTGNGTAGEEIVWDGAAAPAATTYLGTVTGFKVLGIGSGVAAAASQVFDLSKITGFSGLDVEANSTLNTIQLINAASASPLSIDGAFAGTLVYATADTTGPADTVAVTLGAASNSTGFTVAALTLEDSSHFGIGTVNLVSNAGTGQVNTITAFQDASLSTLSLTGTGSTTISNAFTTNATTLTINANATNGTAASALTFGGGISGTSLTTLTLTGTENISLGTVTQGTGNFTVAGSADNANISLALAGVTSSGHTVGITLGNGNNVVTDTSAAAGASVNITLGNGNNTVTVGATATNTVVLGTGHNNVIEAAGGNVNLTFGAHTASGSAAVIDNLTVGPATGATAAPSAVVTGFNVKGVDTITFSGDAGATGAIVAYTTAQINTFGNNPTNLATAIAGVLAAGGGDLAQHAVGEFTFQNNTYFVEQAGATGSAFAADTIVELTGNQTFTTATNAAAGVLHLVG